MTSGGMQPHPEALYYHIAADALRAAENEQDEFERKKLITTAMVFCALCLEAFVNQQHEWQSKHIGLIEKWRQLPRLLGAPKSFAEDEEPFRTFVDLIGTRNHRLVHFKPAGERQYTGLRPNRRYFGDMVNDLDLARSYVNCVPAMIEQLNRLIGGPTDLPGFLEGQKYLSYVWVSVTVPYEVAPRSPDESE
jgi:hypothetical protein